MPPPKVTAEKIERVQKMTGMGLMEAKRHLAHCEGDVLLAVGYARAFGLAVNIRGGEDVRERWNMSCAKSFKEDYLAEHPDEQGLYGLGSAENASDDAR